MTAVPPPTQHRLRVGDARERIAGLPPVHLVVTSPPYPMVQMWDEALSAASPTAAQALQDGAAEVAFEAMHADVLDPVWAACAEVLVPGGFLVVNIGDATRTLAGDFRLWSNHARVLTAAAALGFHALPDILWRKPTNAPNRFMGSGMLPAGAYVTYEHEYVLVLRKGGRRVIRSPEDRARRRQSAYFWEERNQWFSDVWTGLPGARQTPGGLDHATRKRSAAYPLELPWRLIQMWSLQGDTVLDPFCGLGTTLLAAAATARHSVGIELDPGLVQAVSATLGATPEVGAARSSQRAAEHARFVAERLASGKSLRHVHEASEVPVITGQETSLVIPRPVRIAGSAATGWTTFYDTEPLQLQPPPAPTPAPPKKRPSRRRKRSANPDQVSLFGTPEPPCDAPSTS